MLKRTPLFETHQRLGGRLVEFGGWEMPVQYTGILDEHLAVRQAAGLFDISHMGELFVVGLDAAAFLNRVLTNDVEKLAVGQGQYTLMCHERGGVVDDLYVFRVEEVRYLLILNASRTEADVAWLRHQFEAMVVDTRTYLDDRSAGCGALAVQGPRAVEFIARCFPGESDVGLEVASVLELKKNRIGRFHLAKGRIPAWVSRTGYTGEDGFELVVNAEDTPRVWEAVLAEGRAHGLKPAGLGARDTLRTEMCFPLYGHELDEQTTPIEAGLERFVALGKAEFLGREALAAQKEQGVTRQLVAFKVPAKAPPPRPHYALCRPGDVSVRIGEVVSGTLSPSLGVGIGLGYVPPADAVPGTVLGVDIRGRAVEAVVVPRPLYRKTG